jgi:hypothetical protein
MPCIFSQEAVESCVAAKFSDFHNLITGNVIMIQELAISIFPSKVSALLTYMEIKDFTVLETRGAEKIGHPVSILSDVTIRGRLVRLQKLFRKKGPAQIHPQPDSIEFATQQDTGTETTFKSSPPASPKSQIEPSPVKSVISPRKMNVTVQPAVPNSKVAATLLHLITQNSRPRTPARSNMTLQTSQVAKDQLAITPAVTQAHPVESPSKIPNECDQEVEVDSVDLKKHDSEKDVSRMKEVILQTQPLVGDVSDLSQAVDKIENLPAQDRVTAAVDQSDEDELIPNLQTLDLWWIVSTSTSFSVDNADALAARWSHHS